MTEDAVKDTIYELIGSKPIIMIAYRLTTVGQADVVYLMDKGRSVACAGHDELLAESERFRAMAKM